MILSENEVNVQDNHYIGVAKVNEGQYNYVIDR